MRPLSTVAIFGLCCVLAGFLIGFTLANSRCVGLMDSLDATYQQSVYDLATSYARSIARATKAHKIPVGEGNVYLNPRMFVTSWPAGAGKGIAPDPTTVNFDLEGRSVGRVQVDWQHRRIRCYRP